MTPDPDAAAGGPADEDGDGDAGRRGSGLPRGSVPAAVGLLALALVGVLRPGADPWSWTVLLPGFLVSAASVAVGLVLHAEPRLRRDGLAWTASGVVGLIALGGSGGWLPAVVAERAGLLATLCLLPLAVVGYPGTLTALHRVVVLPLLGLAGVVVLVLGDGPVLVEALVLVVPLVVIGSVWWRFERGVERHPGPDRDALRWLALSLALMVVVLIPATFSRLELPGLVASTLALLAVPAAVGLSARRPGVVEIRTVAARAGGLLLTLVVAFAVFAGAVSGLRAAGVPVDDVGSHGVVAMAVALLFEPVRRLLARAVEQLLFGDRLDPVGAASRFAAELATADDPVAALRALRRVLDLPYAAVADGRSVVASGRPAPSGHVTLPLTAAGHRVGELRLGLRPGESGPSARDRPVLRIVVPALAQALRARTLAGEVAASRERVVTAVEEDRRRLRRDLHDGLGPTLTGVAYATDAARNLLRTDPALAEELLAGARADTGTAITDVRLLVDGLRPAVLDQLGLPGALRQHAASLRGADGGRVEVALDLPDDLPPLSAATEVAVFRIATEALTNVARHSGSPTARVTLRVVEDRLVLEVRDAGSGAGPVAWVPGVGLQSMRERADQLGGTVDAGTDGPGGLVRVALPLPAPWPGPDTRAG